MPHQLSAILAPGAENTPIHTYAPKEGTLWVIEWHLSGGQIYRSGPVYPYIRTFASGYIREAQRAWLQVTSIRVPIEVAKILSGH